MTQIATPDVAFAFFQDIAEDLSREDLVFPTFLQASAAVREALTREEWPVRELAQRVSGEPLLSARVVALANSAAFNATGQEVSDLQTACLRVGYRAVRNLATTLLLEQAVAAGELMPFRQQAREIWEHSLAVAVIASVLAEKTGRCNPEEALFAGLVHDLGHFYLYWRAARVPALVAEPERIRTLAHDWHCAIGQRLLWDLAVPETIVKSCEEHEIEPAALQAGSLSELLCVANLCSMAHQDVHRADAEGEVDPSRLSLREARAIVKEHASAIATLLAALMGPASPRRPSRTSGGAGP